MDDLYANAWNDRADPPLSDLKPSTSSNTSWLSPKLPDAHEEADLAAPSWSTGAGIAWNEPSDNAGFSWGQADTDLAWDSSTYDDIQIRNPASIAVDDDVHAAEAQDVEEVPSVPVSPALPATTALDVYQTHEPSPPAAREVLDVTVPLADAEALSLPADQDAFGTFESALVPDEDTAVALEASDVNVDAWGAAWAETKEAEAEPVDEWEAARQRKAQQDRKVPPAVIAALLRDTEQFCEDAWPEPKSADTTDKDDWRNNWRRGLEGVEGLEALVNTVLPPLSLQPPVKFGKTAMAKRMAMSVRQTKNMAMSKRSPMAHYLAAKGSTAWEVAVKERKEVIGDDMPAGWRILDKDTAADAASSTGKEKKLAGRLFSFWGRRDSGTTHTRSSSQSDVKDEVDSRSLVSNEIAGHSRRPSQDSVRSLGSGNADKITPSPRQSSSSPALSASASATSVSSAPTRPASYADAPEPQVDPSSGAQAPSAVSRFLNKFSRRRSAMGSGNPRNSLALSSDDFDFLAEIPSANDGDDDEDTRMRAFESVFNSKPQSSVLPSPLPPPLPPPPSVNMGARAEASKSTAMDSLDSQFGLLDSTSFTTAPGPPAAPPSSSYTSPLQPMTAIPVLEPSRPATPPVGVPRQDTQPASPSPLSVERKAVPAQPFFLPSPPSSRSHTPLSTVRGALGESARSQTPPVTQEAVQGASSSRAPPPLFPPPRAPAPVSFPNDMLNPPDTPTSGLPLAQLYPDAFRAQADTGRSGSRPVGTLPPLLAPPPAPSRQPSEPSPLLPPSVAPKQSAATPPPSVLAIPSGPPKPSALALASPVDNDDEEFSDFLSSATVPTSSKPLVRSISASSRSSTPRKTPPSSIGRSGGKAPALAHLRIGSTSHRSVSGTSSPPAKLSLLDDSDNFSDFQESPATSQPQSSRPFSDDYFSAFRSPATSQPLQSQHLQSRSTGSFKQVVNDSTASEGVSLNPKKDLGFDFLDSYTSSLRTPSPPPLISKVQRIPSSSSSNRSATVSRGVAEASSLRASKAASHRHTLNLMEKAASRPGRWPAPPSPLPQAIPGPEWAPSNKASADLLGDDGSPERPKAGGVTIAHSSSVPSDTSRPTPTVGASNGIAPILPAPSLFQSHSSQSSQPTSLDFLQRMGTPPTVSQVPVANHALKQDTAKTGGLSAQDLMFFEGL
ncbi:hypothetical protein DAEQUDRAFT_759148 [Daedalea quercina L-15889]|uniref:Uncharacterized protein n=1 Tax=Daedalea quercina L-15889 TaxID=1314783 RepID=A0A165MIS6_9APHY|nr:hypothetical protein DAEQUDRAFT_759148 [Daedalea quercina L-15889]